MIITKIELEFKEVNQLLEELGVNPHGAVQKFFTSELLRASDPYTPFKEGILKGSARIADDGTYIEYNTPYARYLWYGKLMVDPKTGSSWARPGVQKQLTGIDLKYQGAPIRGRRWVERAYLDNKRTLLSSIEKFANSRGVRR